MKIWRSIVGVVTIITVSVALFMVLLINIDVFCRTVLGRPIPLSVEFTTFGFALTTFLPLVLVAQEGREISFDLVMSRLPRRAQFLVRTLYSVVGAVVVLIIFRSVWKKFVWAWEVGDYIPSSPILLTAIPWGAIAIGLLLYAIELVRIAIESATLTFRSDGGGK